MWPSSKDVLKGSWSLLAFFLVCLPLCSAQVISEKGRKFNNQDLSTTEDPFFSFDSPDFGQPAFLDSATEQEVQANEPEEDAFGDDFGFDDFGFDDDLPPCYSLSEDELEYGVDCDNSTAPPEPEIRHRDPLFERLLSQVWSDYQTKLNNDASLYGFVVDPLDVDALLPATAEGGGGGGGIELSESGAGYSADVSMQGIKVYGLSGINMSDNVVTRSENLTDIDLKITFAFDRLVINGTYSLKGYVGFWGVDSEGVQNFEIVMKKATLTYGTKMDLVDPDSDWAGRRCDETHFLSPDSNPDVLITEISLPLQYQDVDFRFDNLGAFANNLVNGIGMYFLRTQEEVIVAEIRKNIKQHVNSLIC